MNTQYRKNLKDVATACKNYTDKRFDDFKWELGTHTIDTATDSDVAYQKQAPNGTIGCQIENVGGMSYKSENLLVLDDVAETTINGVTYKIENGVITLNGTSTSNSNLVINLVNEIPIGTYFLKAWNTKGTWTNASLNNYSPYIYCQNITTRTDGSESGTNTTTDVASSIRIYIPNGHIITNYNIMPMLVKGSTAPTTFKQGFEGIRDSAVTSIVANSTFTIPASIQSLAGYGWGINDTCYNYIDFENKKFVQKVGRVNLGTLTWTYNSSVGRFGATDFSTYKKPTDNNTALVGLCEMYSITSWNDLVNNNTDMNIAVLSSNNNIIVRNTNYTSADTFKSAMSGVYLYYELATPIETDISSYITDNDKFLEVEALGTITFTNTYEQEVPSEITYLTEVAK